MLKFRIISALTLASGLSMALLTACPEKLETTEAETETSPTPIPSPTEEILVHLMPKDPLDVTESATPTPSNSPAKEITTKAEAKNTPDNTQPLSPKMFVKGNPTPIYKEGKTESGVIAELAVSTEVYLLRFNESEQYPGWVMIEFQYDGFPESGWVQRKQLQARPIVSPNSTTQSTAKISNDSDYFINSDRVNLRQGPSTQADIIQVAKLNTAVKTGSQEAQAEGYLWREVQLGDGRKVWVAARFLSQNKVVVVPNLKPVTKPESD